MSLEWRVGCIVVDSGDTVSCLKLCGSRQPSLKRASFSDLRICMFFGAIVSDFIHAIFHTI